MSSPVGLIIGGDNSRNQWEVGKQIGEGACASVHLLEGPAGQSKTSAWVVKVVPLPTKITKKQQTIPERNARLLFYEGQMYQNILPDYRGYILPKLPPYIGPPATGDENGEPVRSYPPKTLSSSLLTPPIRFSISCSREDERTSLGRYSCSPQDRVNSDPGWPNSTAASGLCTISPR